MSAIAGRSPASVRIHSRRHYRLRHHATEAACMFLGFVIVVWSLTPIYNMWMIALDSHETIFSGMLYPEPRRWRRSRRRQSGLLVSRAFLASVRQQFLCWPVGDVPDLGDRLLAKLHGWNGCACAMDGC